MLPGDRNVDSDHSAHLRGLAAADSDDSSTVAFFCGRLGECVSDRDLRRGPRRSDAPDPLARAAGQGPAGEGRTVSVIGGGQRVPAEDLTGRDFIDAECFKTLRNPGPGRQDSRRSRRVPEARCNQWTEDEMHERRHRQTHESVVLDEHGKMQRASRAESTGAPLANAATREIIEHGSLRGSVSGSVSFAQCIAPTARATTEAWARTLAARQPRPRMVTYL